MNPKQQTWNASADFAVDYGYLEDDLGVLLRMAP